MLKENKDKNYQQEQEDKRKRKGRRIRVLLTIIITVVLLLLVLKSCKSDFKLPSTIEEVVDIVWADSQKGKEETDKETLEERQDRINKEAMKGMLTIDLNVTPVFENGTAEGNFQFYNDINNFYLMQVEVYRDDTKELIYKSGLIKQDDTLATDKLNVVLKKGTYECTAYFLAIDNETYVLRGKVGSKMTITVLN